MLAEGAGFELILVLHTITNFWIDFLFVEQFVLLNELSARTEQARWSVYNLPDMKRLLIALALTATVVLAGCDTPKFSEGEAVAFVQQMTRAKCNWPPGPSNFRVAEIFVKAENIWEGI